MKKIIILILCLMLIPFSAFADYPIIPENIVTECKIRFNVDDAGSRLLYEKVDIGDGIYAWMLGWFWSDKKIVVGITDKSDIIYYNKANLGDTPSGIEEAITAEEGRTVAEEFLKKCVSKNGLTLISSKSYTYKFAKYHHGIRVIGHEATVVVDKSTGEVSYYKGFGDSDMSYVLLDGLISKDYAYNIFFDKIGLELVYSCKYSEDGYVKTARPMYIANNLKNEAVNAESGEILNITMTDYNYYYNDLYYDTKYFRDNNISDSMGSFVKNKLTDGSESKFLTNIIYSLKRGYHFKVLDGTYFYTGETSVPAYRIDFVPTGFETQIDRAIADYDKNIFDNIDEIDTTREFLYGRAYINAGTGKIIKFDAIKNPKTMVKETEIKQIPVRVADALKFGTEKPEVVRFFDSFTDNDGTVTFYFARFVDNIRAIGEGTIIKYDPTLDEVVYILENNIINRFPSVKYAKTVFETARLIKNEIPFGICYVDKNEKEKMAVYDILDNEIAFDPITGARLDLTDTKNTSTLYVCRVGSGDYLVNGVSVAAPPPVADANGVYLPFRFIGENCGYSVSYDDGLIYAKSGNDVLYFAPNSSMYIINEKPVFLSPSVIKDGTTYIPVSAVNKLLGLYSDWDEDTNMISIYN